MSTNKLDVTIRTMAGAWMLSALLAGCSKPVPQPEATPPPAPASETTPPADTVPPESAPTAPAQPAPDAPPPTEPSAAPKPSAAAEPSLESMHVAAPSNAKISVAADVRYQFDGAALPNQPVTLHLAAVPRVAGGRVGLSVKQVDGVQLAGGTLNQQKTGGTVVYRKQFSVTRGTTSPSELRVLVTLETDAGSSFGFFSVPFDSGTNAQKGQESVKQR